MKELFLQILNMSITASWLVLVIAIIRLVFKRAPKSMICFLWVFVAIRLVIPFSFESALSLIPATEYITEDTGIVQSDISEGNLQVPVDSDVQVVFPDQKFNADLNETTPAVDQKPSTETHSELQWMEILSWLWVGGILIMAGYAIYSYQKIHRQVQASLNTQENIYICDDLSSPFILGVLKPKIYLPSTLKQTEMKYIIAHEKAHLSRHDHWWKPLGYGLLSVYWFNPVIWVAYILLCRDIEMACDEKVIQMLGEENKQDYSRTLLMCSVPRHLIAACPLAFGEVSVKQRVKSVLNYRKPAFWVIVCAIVVLCAFPVFFLSNPKDKIPDTVNVVRLEDGTTFDLTQEYEKDLLAEFLKLSYKESHTPWEYEYQFELDDSVYEVIVGEAYISVRKNQSFVARIEDETVINDYLMMFGESPSVFSGDLISLESAHQASKTKMTDLNTNTDYTIDQWTETIVHWFDSDAVKVLDADLETYINKQSTLENGNERILSLTLSDSSGNELKTLKLFEEGSLVEINGKLAVVEADLEFLKDYLDVKCEDCVVSGERPGLEETDSETIALLGFDPMQADNIKALGGAGGMGVDSDHVAYQSVLADNYYFEILNGKLSIIKTSTAEKHTFDEPTDFIALASYGYCDGTNVYGLTGSGKVYEINTDHYQNYWDGKFQYTFEEGLSEVLRAYDLEEKVVGLAVKDDTDPYTTCGGFALYGIDAEGRMRTLDSFRAGQSYQGSERKDIHPYMNFIRVETVRGRTPHPMGTEENPVTYLLFMEDGSAMLGYDYGEFDLRWDNEYLIYNNEILKFTRIITEISAESNEGNVFLVADDHQIYCLMIDESDGEEIVLNHMGEMETLIFEVNEKGNQICRGIKRTDGTTIDVASKYTNFRYLSDGSKIQDMIANGEAFVNTVEIWGVSQHGEEEWVYFGAQNPSDNFDVSLPAGTLAEYKMGDVVEIVYTTQQISEYRKEYTLLSIKKTTGLYEKAVILSEIVGFTPVKIHIKEGSLSGTEELILESSDDIAFFMKKMDEIPVYEDYVEQFGAGGPIYVMTFTDKQGETVEISSDLIVSVKNKNGEMKYGPHRTEENKETYNSVLYEMFHE